MPRLTVSVFVVLTDLDFATDLLTDVIVRIFFMLIQFILFLVFEHRMHLCQHKVLVALLLNAIMLFGSCQLNPFCTFAIILVIIGPYFQRLEF